jgi:hypothetical protein
MAEHSSQQPDEGAGPPEKWPARVPRDRSGRVTKGAVLNPGGRPAGWAEFRSRMRERTEEAEAFVLKCLRRGEPEEQRWAATTILQYAWGKPPQRLQVSGDDEAPPVKTETTLDLSKLSLEQQIALLDLADTLGDQGHG